MENKRAKSELIEFPDPPEAWHPNYKQLFQIWCDYYQKKFLGASKDLNTSSKGEGVPLDLIKIDYQKKTLDFKWFEDDTEFCLTFPDPDSTSKDEIFFAQPGPGNPWSNELNAFILEKSPTFFQIMDKLIVLSYVEEDEEDEGLDDTVESQDLRDSLRRSSNSLGLKDSAELDVFSGGFAESEPKFAQILQDRVDHVNKQIGQRAAIFNEDTGTVTLIVPIDDVLSKSLANLLDLALSEALVISLDYRRKAFDDPKDTNRMPTFSLQQSKNSGFGTKKSIVREIIRSFVERNYLNPIVFISEKDFDQPDTKSVLTE